MTTIILADDHRIVRQGIKVLLESEPDFQVVGEASDGLEALSLIKKLQPEILVTDITMPGRSGLQVLEEIKNRSLSTKTIVLSMHCSQALATRAFDLGASGYLIKDTSVEHLVAAIREAMAGGCYVSPPLILPQKTSC